MVAVAYADECGVAVCAGGGDEACWFRFWRTPRACCSDPSGHVVGWQFAAFTKRECAAALIGTGGTVDAAFAWAAGDVRPAYNTSAVFCFVGRAWNRAAVVHLAHPTGNFGAIAIRFAAENYLGWLVSGAVGNLDVCVAGFLEFDGPLGGIAFDGSVTCTFAALARTVGLVVAVVEFVAAMWALGHGLTFD